MKDCDLCGRTHSEGFCTRQVERPDLSRSVKGERLRYRRNWRGKLILQVEEMVPYNYDERDPYQIEPGGYHGRWRDAVLGDLPYPGLGVV